MSTVEDGLPRRTVVQGLAWTAPTILAAVSAPAAAGSQPPPPPPPACIPGVTYAWVDRDLWNGQNLPQGVQIYNNSGQDLTLKGEVTNTPSFYGVANEEATVVMAHNGGAFSIVVPDGGSVILRIEVTKDSNNSTGFMQFFNLCDGLGRFQMKTVLKKDRL